MRAIFVLFVVLTCVFIYVFVGVFLYPIFCKYLKQVFKTTYDSEEVGATAAAILWPIAVVTFVPVVGAVVLAQRAHHRLNKRKKIGGVKEEDLLAALGIDKPDADTPEAWTLKSIYEAYWNKELPDGKFGEIFQRLKRGETVYK